MSASHCCCLQLDSRHFATTPFHARGTQSNCATPTSQAETDSDCGSWASVKELRPSQELWPGRVDQTKQRSLRATCRRLRIQAKRAGWRNVEIGRPQLHIVGPAEVSGEMCV